MKLNTNNDMSKEKKIGTINDKFFDRVTMYEQIVIPINGELMINTICEIDFVITEGYMVGKDEGLYIKDEKERRCKLQGFSGKDVSDGIGGVYFLNPLVKS